MKKFLILFFLLFSTASFSKESDVRLNEIKPKPQNADALIKNIALIKSIDAKNFWSTIDTLSKELNLLKSNRTGNPQKLEGNFIFNAIEDTETGGDVVRYKISLKHKFSKTSYDLGSNEWTSICSNKKIAATNHFLIYDTGKSFEFYTYPLKGDNYSSIEGWDKNCKTILISESTCPYDCPKDSKVNFYKVRFK